MPGPSLLGRCSVWLVHELFAVNEPVGAGVGFLLDRVDPGAAVPQVGPWSPMEALTGTSVGPHDDPAITQMSDFGGVLPSRYRDDAVPEPGDDEGCASECVERGCPASFAYGVRVG